LWMLESSIPLRANVFYAAVYDATSHQPGRDMDGFEKLTVAAAADRMGTSQDAVRKRIHRNTIKWEKDEDGRVYVYLDASETRQATDQDASETASGTAVEILQAQVSHLQEILRIRDEEIRRHQHLLAAALERIPQIEAPQEPPPETRDSDLTPFEKAAKGDTPPGDKEQPRVPWWQRWFGG
jgi:hypothetical protein